MQKFDPSLFGGTIWKSPLDELKTIFPDKVVDGVLHTCFPGVRKHLKHKGADISVIVPENDNMKVFFIGRTHDGQLVTSSMKDGITLTQAKQILDSGKSTTEVFNLDSMFLDWNDVPRIWNDLFELKS
jgi:hypothetical protein